MHTKMQQPETQSTLALLSEGESGKEDDFRSVALSSLALITSPLPGYFQLNLSSTKCPCAIPCDLGMNK